ncbi:hypothetical protein M5D96_006379 [Drosophila gunungcola]|uniref:Uncharacterized protein n=1 Tax=Drosophila gunungcola TaxID=103775 RepID=A0A9P9YNZ3_9MUSC|nr:hypothetical protein M5D96_006379 [Drosophila gunungcola]
MVLGLELELKLEFEFGAQRNTQVCQPLNLCCACQRSGRGCGMGFAIPAPSQFGISSSNSYALEGSKEWKKNPKGLEVNRVKSGGEWKSRKGGTARWFGTYFGSFFGALKGAWRSLMCNEIGFLLPTYPLPFRRRGGVAIKLACGLSSILQLQQQHQRHSSNMAGRTAATSAANAAKRVQVYCLEASQFGPLQELAKSESRIRRMRRVQRIHSTDRDGVGDGAADDDVATGGIADKPISGHGKRAAKSQKGPKINAWPSRVTGLEAVAMAKYIYWIYVARTEAGCLFVAAPAQWMREINLKPVKEREAVAIGGQREFLAQWPPTGQCRQYYTSGYKYYNAVTPSF